MRFGIAHISVAALSAGLIACSAPGQHSTRPNSTFDLTAPASGFTQDAAVSTLAPDAPNTDSDSRFPVDDARILFGYGYSTVSDRYIETVSIDRFALDGLEGLSELDETVQVENAGNKVVLSQNGTPVGVFDRPLAGDSNGWGQLTAEMLQTAQGAIPSLEGVDPETLYEAVFDASLAGLDPFSHYASRDEARLNQGTRTGFGGIGIVYDLDEIGVRITTVFKDTPAARGGLAVGDHIVEIEGSGVSDMDRREVRDRLRGPASSIVTVTVQTNGVRRSVDLRRSLIVTPTVELDVDRGIAFIDVTRFNQRTTNAIAEAVANARAETGGALIGLVLDMRGNPGGLLDQAVSTSNLFLNSGPIVSTKGRHPGAKQIYAASRGDIALGVPMVVIVDGDSASAAEIVAAALQDNGRAVVIGTTSYGKGTVQTVVQLPNGGEMTLTWSRFYSPSGYVLHGLGVLPVACTSGLGNLKDLIGADAVIANMRTERLEIAEQLALWRATPSSSNTVRRETLRRNCPAEHHPDAAIDREVADKLLRDADLYDRVLRLAAPQQALSWSEDVIGSEVFYRP